MPTKQEVLEKALELSVSERCELACELWESAVPLDEEEALTNDDWAAAWESEIERRRRSVASGESRLVPGE
jgi:hypothetical protein